MWLTLTNRTAQLLYGVVVALPFVALHLAYGVTSLMLELDHSSSTFLTSVSIKVILSVVPEIVVTIALVGFSIITRNINRLWPEVISMRESVRGFRWGLKEDRGWRASRG